MEALVHVGLTNAALAQAIPGTTARSDDFSITITAAAIDAFSRLDAVSICPLFSAEVIRDLKFITCLSERIAASTIEARLLDRNGIQATLSRATRLLYAAR